MTLGKEPLARIEKVYHGNLLEIRDAFQTRQKH